MSGFGPKDYTVQIISCASFLITYVGPIKIYSKVTHCANKVIPCANKVTWCAKCTKSLGTVAPAGLCLNLWL